MFPAVTRRFALGLAGVGSVVAALTSCGAGADYKGEAKLDRYDTSAGPYEPATQEHPSKNVPVPIKPDNMGENSVAGLHATICYFAASLQYMMNTGDSQHLKDIRFDREDLKSYTDVAERFDDKTWLSEVTVTIELTTSAPIRNTDGYQWPAKLTMKQGDFALIRGKVSQVPQNRKLVQSEGDITGRYVEGSWNLSTPKKR